MENKIYRALNVRQTPEDPTLMTQAMILREIGHADALAKQARDTMQTEIRGLRTQIEERDSRVVVAAHEAKTAVDAAFESQERAIAKSELSVAKQLDQHAALLSTTAHGLSDKIDDLKERLLLLEGSESGGKNTSMSIQSIIGLISAIVIGGGGLLLSLLRKTP